MKKKLITIFLGGLIIGIVFIMALTGTAEAEFNTIYVPDDYSTIQEAVDAADSGDTILVSSGVYREEVTIDKQLTLRGISTDAANPIIDAEVHVGTKNGINVRANGVNIEGFKIINARVGIHLSNSTNNTLKNNIFEQNNYYGISLEYSDFNNVANNTINPGQNGEGSGIYLHSSDINIINGNKISIIGKYSSGIALKGSSNNHIVTNEIQHDISATSVVGVGVGISVERSIGHSFGNLISNNIISNTKQGISLHKFSYNNIINNNVFTHTGLFVYDSYNNTVSGNTLDDRPIIYFENVSDKTISDAEIGQLILVNSDNITVTNLDIYFGTQLLNVNNSRFENNKTDLSPLLKWASINGYIFSAKRPGIYLKNSSNNTVNNNDFIYTSKGISLDFSEANIIESNYIKVGGHNGLYLNLSNNNIIINNNVVSYEIILKYSNGNVVTLNNFFNFSSGGSYDSTDIWHSTEELIYAYQENTYTNYLGNYWDNYTGIDNNKDGIGDTLYNVNSDQDNYPLMQPFENYIIGEIPPENQPPTCIIELQKDGVEINEINAGESFDIYVGDSTDGTGITKVRFSSDESQNGIAEGEWVEYNWDVSLDDWDSETKIKKWSFSTNGDKKVWAEVMDGNNNASACFANISAKYPDFSFIHMTDPHIGYGEESYTRFTDGLYEIGEGPDKPEFILMGGDLVEWAKEEYLEDYQSLIDSFTKQYNIPVYSIPGNHDRYKYRYLPHFSNDYLEQYYDSIGKPEDVDILSKFKEYSEFNKNSDEGLDWYNYSFKHGGFQFIGLDSGADIGPPVSPPRGGGLHKDHIDALNELEQNIPKIIFMHHPVVNPAINYFWWESCDGCISEEQRQNFINFVTSSNVQLVLSGHTHEDYIFNALGANYLVPPDNVKPLFIQTRSATKDGGQNDTIKHGYRIIDIRNGIAYPYSSSQTGFYSKIISKIDKTLGNIDFRVYDPNNSSNNITLKDEGGIIDNIEFSAPFFVASSSKRVILYDHNKNSKFEIAGLKTDEDSEYDLEVKLEGENISACFIGWGVYISNTSLEMPGSPWLMTGCDIEKDIVKFDLKNIKLKSEDIHQIIVDWEVFIASGGKDGITFKRYIDGDGNFEIKVNLLEFRNKINIDLGSPGELQVVDFEGRITGMAGGVIKEEIPYSKYDAEKEMVIIFSNDDSFNDLTYQIVGTYEDTYDLSITTEEHREENGNFMVNDMPTNNSVTHQYAVDWQVLSQGGKGVTLQVDVEGDGIFDQTILAGGVFYIENTNLSYQGDVSGQFSDFINFEALLTNKEGIGIANKEVIFTFGNQTAISCITDENGVATATLELKLIPVKPTKTYPIKVLFPGDDSYLIAKTQAEFTLKSAKKLKQETLAKLRDITTDNKQAQKAIDKAIEDIENSLNSEFWTDASRLDQQQGHKVFDNKKQAIKSLLKIIEEKGEHDDSAIIAGIQAVIGNLAKADILLAKVAIYDAESIEIDDTDLLRKKIDSEISKAKEELGKALQELDDSNPDKAIDYLKKSWKSAQLAIDFLLDKTNRWRYKYLSGADVMYAGE